MAAKSITLKQEVWLVCDDPVYNKQNGTNWKPNEVDEAEVLGVKARLCINYNPSASVLFRLSTSIVQSSRYNILYLQILPDRFLSFENIIYNGRNERDHPPYLHNIRKKIGVAGDTGEVMRLKVKLNNPGDLLTPKDFISDGLQMKSLYESSPLDLLATMSVFSLYMRPNVLSIDQFSSIDSAIKQWSQTTPDQKRKFMQMVDMESLYNGKGAKLYHHSLSPDSAEWRCRFQSPTGSESDNATIATNTPPRYHRYAHDDRENKIQFPVDTPDVTVVAGEAYKLDVVSSTCATGNASKDRMPISNSVCAITAQHVTSGTNKPNITQAKDKSAEAEARSRTPVDSPPNYYHRPHAGSHTLPTYPQADNNVASPVQALSKRHRSSDESADSRPPKRLGSQSFAACDVSPESRGKSKNGITESLMDTLGFHFHYGHDYSRMDNLERIIGALMSKNKQLEARLSQQQLDIQGLIAKNEELEARFFKQQSETQSLTGSANKLYDKDNHSIYLDNLAERQDELERRQEECEESQGMIQQRQETMEESIEAIDVRVTELDGLLDDDWKLQLFDEMRGESVAGVKEFLRNI